MCLSKKKPGLNLAFSWMKQISGEEYKTRKMIWSFWSSLIQNYKVLERPNIFCIFESRSHQITKTILLAAAIWVFWSARQPSEHMSLSLSSTLCVRTACSFSLGNQCCFCAIVSIKTVLPALLIFQSCCSKKDAHSGCIFLSKTQIVPHPGISSVSIFYLSNPNST